MRTTIQIFSSKLRQAMGNPVSVEAEGATVGQCLDNLVGQYPDIQGILFDRQRRLRREVYVYVNAESLHKIEMTRPLKPGDVLIVATLVTGG